MIYSSKRAAALTLIEFTPAMRRLHEVIPATVGGKRVGWTVVMRSEASKRGGQVKPRKLTP